MSDGGRAGAGTGRGDSGAERPEAVTRPVVETAVAKLVEQLRETRPTLVVLAGPILGARIPLVQQVTVLGRSGDCDLTIPDDGISGRHAEVRFRDDGRFEIRDLGSTNGTLVNGDPVGEHVLEEGDRIVVGHTPMRFTVYAAGEDDLLSNLEVRATHDGLTGTANRRYLEARLAQEVRFAARRGTSVSLLLIDVDHFRTVNEASGHPVGDRMLLEIAAYLSGCVRTEDVVGRWGGDVFAVILRDVGPEGAGTLAERLRSGVAGFPFLHDGNRIPISVSVGVATATGRKDLRSPVLTDEADRQLVRAKDAGRNRVCEGTV